MQCRQWNLHIQHYTQLHLEELSMPMCFIVVDIIGTFKLLPLGHQYTLTVLDMLMNYTSYLLLYTKEADEVVHT